jgi:hypothetical protein
MDAVQTEQNEGHAIIPTVQLSRRLREALDAAIAENECTIAEFVRQAIREKIARMKAPSATLPAQETTTT